MMNGNNKMRKIFIDCGGHVGESILLFKKSKLYDKSYKIFSFEPVPYLAEYYKDWKGISFLQRAVWIYDGTIDFYLSKKLDDGNTLFKGKKTGGVDKENPIKVVCIDFSEWLYWRFDTDDYIILKMDIEGAEFKVLYKMIEDKTIDLINKLYIEWHFSFDNFPDKQLHSYILII